MYILIAKNMRTEKWRTKTSQFKLLSSHILKEIGGDIYVY